MRLRDEGGEAFVMDAGQRVDQVAETIREAYLDRKELCFTIRFLGAQTASRVLAQQESLAQQSRNAARSIELKQQREQQQQEAASLLRNRLGKASQSKGSTAVSSSESVVATPSSSASELALDWSPTSSYSAGSTRRSHRGERSYGMSPGNNQEEVQVEEGVHAAATLAMLHWCPLTTALVIVDVQNYFTLPHGYGARRTTASSDSKKDPRGLDAQFYDRVDNVLIPTIQDVLLACRASEGMEVVYSVVESATRDGRERSRAHKHAGIHVSKNGFGAQVPKRIAPVDESDIVLSRTGVNNEPGLHPAKLDALVDAVISSVDHKEEAQDAEVLPIGGYLWKFPSEGSNRIESSSKILPPPAPQILDYPRECGQCGVCWVSDRAFELDHMRQCSVVTHVDIQEKAPNLGVARRVWCEVDGSFSRLQWRHDRDLDSGDNAINFIAFVDIAEISVLDEPAQSFQIVTLDHRTVVFQWRPGSETTSDLVPYRLELDARQWQEYLEELSRYARNLPVEEPATWSVADVYKEISGALSGSSAQDTRAVLKSKLNSVLKKCHPSSLCDDDGNSLVHLAISLNLGERIADIVSVLLDLGVDCNLQNHDGESPLLLVAASGDTASKCAAYRSIYSSQFIVRSRGYSFPCCSERW
ncbi:hypothetical protein PC128_g20936 [Phytophthora cactorum]|nr:hypothetical protein PC128_g20936 [Phytophthora cactorum]